MTIKNKLALKIWYDPVSGAVNIIMKGRPELVLPFGREKMDYLRIEGDVWGSYLPPLIAETGDEYDRREMRGIVAMFVGLHPTVSETELREGIGAFRMEVA